MTTKPASHGQYCSIKPGSGALVTGWTIGAGGLGGWTGGTSCTAAGAGAATGAGGSTLGAIGLTLASFFLAACLGAGSGLSAGCSAMAGTGCVAATAGFSAVADAWLVAATGAGSDLVAQADKANTETNSVTGIATRRALDMGSSRNIRWHQANTGFTALWLTPANKPILLPRGQEPEQACLYLSLCLNFTGHVLLRTCALV